MSDDANHDRVARLEARVFALESQMNGDNTRVGVFPRMFGDGKTWGVSQQMAALWMLNNWLLVPLSAMAGALIQHIATRLKGGGP